MKLQLIPMVALATTLTTAANAQNETITVTMDGTPVYFTGPGPTLIDGRPMVPLRGVIEAAGGSVVWDPYLKTALAQKDQTDIKVTLGTNAATVDGQTHYMEAPPVLYNGRTYVPASFIGDALGKEAQYLSAENRIVFSTMVAEEPSTEITMQDPTTETIVVQEPTTIVVQEPARISTFTVQADSWLSPGDTVAIHMVGTPGLNATARIAGVDGEIVMYERTPGHYYGTWIVPSGSDIYLPEARVTGYLRGVPMDAEPFMLDWSDTLYVDTSMPTITSVSPGQGAFVMSDRVRVSADLNDAGSGIDRDGFRLMVNGIDRTNEATFRDGKLYWKPRTEDITPKMNMELTVRDKAGNETMQVWSFRTDKSEWYPF